jgi:hypothetical protein
MNTAQPMIAFVTVCVVIAALVFALAAIVGGVFAKRLVG